MILTLRIIHILAAASLVGAVIFNYFLLRPALRLIPPAHATVIAQRVATLFTNLGWTALGLLVFSGVLRLYYGGNLGLLISRDLYAASNGRAVALMIVLWLLTASSSAVITFVLRPRVINKPPAGPKTGVAGEEKKRMTQMEASVWLDRLELVNVFTSTLALIAGASVIHGGLF